MKRWTLPRSSLLLIWLIIAIVIWQELFTSGQVYGFYWFSVAWEKTRCFLPLVTSLALVGSGVAWVHHWVREQERYRYFRSMTGALAVQLLVVLLFPGFGGPRHLNSTQAAGYTFHLATHFHFVPRFALYRCDRTGQLCRNIFLSGEQYLPFSELVTSFSYDETRGELTTTLMFQDEVWDVIYVYALDN